MEIVRDFAAPPGAGAAPCLPGLEHLLACLQEGLGRALSLALAQLLRNACQAGEAGRPLRVTVGARPADGGAEVWVEDDGRGFAPARLQDLGDTLAGRRGATGPGWGLYLVRQLAAAW